MLVLPPVFPYWVIFSVAEDHPRMTAGWPLDLASGQWNTCSKVETGVMTGLSGRDIIPVPFNEIVGKNREMSSEYYDIARMLAR